MLGSCNNDLLKRSTVEAFFSDKLLKIMKYFYSVALFLLIFGGPMALISLVFSGLSLVFTGLVLFLFFLFIYGNLHRFILMILGAKEIVDTEYHELFQVIKSKSYFFRTKTPRVYLYDGSFKNSFVFGSRSEWIILLDKKLIKSSNKAVMQELISSIFRYHISGQGYLKTKVLGSLILYHYFILQVTSYIFGEKKGTDLRKSFAIFFILLFRPLTLLFEFFMKKGKKVVVEEELRVLYLQKVERDSTLLLSSCLTNKFMNIKKIITEYTESFPFLDSCEFNQ